MENVVQFPMTLAVQLLLKELAGANGTGVITAWLAGAHGARGRFRIRVNNLRRTPQAPGQKKQFHHLQGGLAEIKWTFGKKEFRAVGFYRSGFFLMLVGCTHKQNVCDPPGWLDTAKRRKREVENEQWRTIPFEP